MNFFVFNTQDCSRTIIPQSWLGRWPGRTCGIWQRQGAQSQATPPQNSGDSRQEHPHPPPQAGTSWIKKVHDNNYYKCLSRISRSQDFPHTNKGSGNKMSHMMCINHTWSGVTHVCMHMGWGLIEISQPSCFPIIFHHCFHLYPPFSLLYYSPEERHLHSCQNIETKIFLTLLTESKASVGISITDMYHPNN